MQAFVTRRALLSIPCLVLTQFAIGCGTKQNESVGRDPSIVISVGEPKPSNSSPLQPPALDPNAPPTLPNTGGSSNEPQDGSDSKPINQPPSDNQPPAPRKPTLTVAVNELKNVNGNFCMSIFKSPDGFPDSAEKAIFAECFSISQKSFTIQLSDFPAGRYAIAGWHDENMDKKLNYNLFGIPKEGLSFSENGKPRLTPPPGPPSFESISFEIGSEDKTTQMKTSYLLDLL
ncbi:MAG: hypothetical protein RLZZ488_662 [Pseudomonadota bacterium]|jgi:uncharacterized protein (DUF2141 family)